MRLVLGKTVTLWALSSLTLVVTTEAAATDTGTGPEALLRDHSYELTLEEKLGGPGLEFLLRETADAQFVLLGEPHNQAPGRNLLRNSRNGTPGETQGRKATGPRFLPEGEGG